MSAKYLEEFIRELKRDGEQVFRSHHDSPVLIVTQAGELKSGQNEAKVMADTSGWRINDVSLLNRVFPITRGPFAAPGPVTLGRTDAANVSVPEDSISKRHCVFEVSADGVRLTDVGSTNGTSVDGTALSANVAVALKGGETLQIGNLDFVFHTPDSFVVFLQKQSSG